ncbi:MAG: endolytic transglycosylase MltG [Pseudomonadota bacterium]
MISKLRTGILITLTLIGLYYLALFTWGVVPKPKEGSSAEQRFKVLPKSGVSSIAKQLQDQGMSTPGWLFQAGARSLWAGSKLKPGTYAFPANASLGSVLLQMARGDRIRESVKIIPGMSIWQVRAAMDAHPALIHKSEALETSQFAKVFGLEAPSAEGYFLPDTYIFDPDEADLVIYQRAFAAMQKQLANAWDLYTKGYPDGAVLKNPYQLLILASIVEKETGQASERGMISAVFHNRLKKGMMLQTDPTVIYGIGPKFDGDIKKADLRRDTPYNTYMRFGLPPTPIAMPSKESLLAAAQPAVSNALYFVARGDGSSQFSTNLKEHEAAVDRYQRNPAKSVSKPVRK